MADNTTQMTVIGADTSIKGDMHFDGSARILGKFEGNISAKGELQIADGASCKAVIEAGKVTVDGTIEGNVTARERAELTAKARMMGDLVATRLLVAEGATFTGHVTVGADATKGGGARTVEMHEPKPNQQPQNRPQGQPQQQEALAGARR